MIKCCDCNNTAKLGNMRCGNCQYRVDRENEQDTEREDLNRLISIIYQMANHNETYRVIARALENIAERIW